MATPATAPRTAAQTGAVGRVLGVPHRLFFLAGVSALALISLWWTWVIVARAWAAVPEPPAATLDSTLHALLMTCGFAPFFMFGFVFTAGPRWLGLPPRARAGPIAAGGRGSRGAAHCHRGGRDRLAHARRALLPDDSRERRAGQGAR